VRVAGEQRRDAARALVAAHVVEKVHAAQLRTGHELRHRGTRVHGAADVLEAQRAQARRGPQHRGARADALLAERVVGQVEVLQVGGACERFAELSQRRKHLCLGAPRDDVGHVGGGQRGGGAAQGGCDDGGGLTPDALGAQPHAGERRA